MFNHSSMTPATKLNDLLYYANHSLISPDMTQAIYCIVALELGQPLLAASLFDLSYKRFNFPPYYTWSEKQDGTGNVPYLTSGGGFLQTLQYGYVGVRVLPGRLRLRPHGIRSSPVRTGTGRASSSGGLPAGPPPSPEARPSGEPRGPTLSSGVVARTIP